MKYNIVSNEGERTSVTVFFGGTDNFVATKDHPQFAAICEAVSSSPPADDDAIRALFDVSIPIGKKFTRLSERVMVNNGRIFFDGMAVADEIAQTILKFQAAQVEDFMPLVNFMEKINTNPNPHSQQHLFRWLSKHDFALTPDGDFIAYKGVQRDNYSKTAGKAIVNAELVNGRVLNAPDTIVEMPRDEVTFDPARGCSVGLHAGSWGYASTFVYGGKTLAVKINPRDVVSVPTDAQDAKLRVCRYKVLGVVDAPSDELLYLGARNRTQKVLASKVNEPKPVKAEVEKPKRGQAPAKPKAAAPKKQAVVKLPRYYEQMKAEHFDTLPFSEIRWLAKEWEIKGLGSNPTKDVLIAALVKEAAERLKTW